MAEYSIVFELNSTTRIVIPATDPLSTIFCCYHVSTVLVTEVGDYFVQEDDLKDTVIDLFLKLKKLLKNANSTKARA
jgi:hypothetical protein